MTICSLDELLLLFGTSLLFRVQFLLPYLHIGFSRGKSGGLIFPFLSEFSTVYQFSSVQLLSRVRLFVTPWIAARQASLSITISWSLPRITSIESVMPSSHLILCSPLFLSSIFPNIQGLFQWVTCLHLVAQVLELQLQHQSFQWIFGVDFL